MNQTKTSRLAPTSTATQFSEAFAECEHTPGPWMIYPGGDIASAAVRTPSHTVIKSGNVKGDTIGAAMKNAKLIAAAPELLEACKWLENYVACCCPMSKGSGDYEGLTLARDAIAKATAAR